MTGEPDETAEVGPHRGCDGTISGAPTAPGCLQAAGRPALRRTDTIIDRSIGAKQVDALMLHVAQYCWPKFPAEAAHRTPFATHTHTHAQGDKRSTTTHLRSKPKGLTLQQVEDSQTMTQSPTHA